MNKIKMIIRLLLSSKSILITATGNEEHPWLALPYGIDDDEFEDALTTEWDDV